MLEHLWTHVVRGASEGGRQVRGPHQDTRDAKITKLYQIVLEENVSAGKKINNEVISNNILTSLQ